MNYLVTLAPTILAALALTFSYLQSRDTKKAEIKKILYAKQIDALCAIYEKLSIHVRAIDNKSPSDNMDEVVRTHEEFLSTYNKHSVFVPIAIEGMFSRYIDNVTTRTVSMSLEEFFSNPPTNSVTTRPSNDPGYSKMLLREIKKLIEMN